MRTVAPVTSGYIARLPKTWPVRVCVGGPCNRCNRDDRYSEQYARTSHAPIVDRHSLGYSYKRSSEEPVRIDRETATAYCTDCGWTYMESAPWAKRAVEKMARLHRDSHESARIELICVTRGILPLRGSDNQ